MPASPHLCRALEPWKWHFRLSVRGTTAGRITLWGNAGGSGALWDEGEVQGCSVRSACQTSQPPPISKSPASIKTATDCGASGTCKALDTEINSLVDGPCERGTCGEVLCLGDQVHTCCGRRKLSRTGCSSRMESRSGGQDNM